MMPSFVHLPAQFTDRDNETLWQTVCKWLVAISRGMQAVAPAFDNEKPQDQFIPDRVWRRQSALIVALRDDQDTRR